MKADGEHNEDATSDETQDESPSQTEAPEEETLTKDAIEDMTRGMVYASLAITDDNENTLKKVRRRSNQHFYQPVCYFITSTLDRLADWKGEPLAKAGTQDCDGV